MKQFLPAFLLEENKRFDLLTNKNSKVLLYKFNDWIESLNAEKIKIKHSPFVKDDVGLIKIEEKGKQFLIEKIISAVEKNNLYTINAKNAQKSCLKLKETIEPVGASTNPCMLMLQTHLFSAFIHWNMTELSYLIMT